MPLLLTDILDTRPIGCVSRNLSDNVLNGAGADQRRTSQSCLGPEAKV